MEQDTNLKTVLYVYHPSDLNMLETSINSLRKVSDCKIQLFTDDELPSDFMERNKDLWIHIDIKNAMVGRRALYKVERYCEYAIQNPIEDIIVADVDTLFLSDPFKAFCEKEFDIGLTTRGYEYHFPINAGMIYLRHGENKNRFLNWHVFECSNPDWLPYVSWRKKWGHEKYGSDWTVGQDFLNVAWMHRDSVEETQVLKIDDVGPTYNYCPARDVFTEDVAIKMILDAYASKAASVLHLKSSLKRLLYEGVFDEAVIHYPKQDEFTWRNLP